MSVEEVRELRKLLEPGIEVSFENCFPERVGEKETSGELVSLSYKPGSDTYRIELDTDEVYTVTSNPEDYDYNKYVTRPESITVLDE